MSLPSRPLSREQCIVLALVATVVAIYGQTLGYPFIAFDDPGYVSENAHVRAGLSWAGLCWALTTFAQSNWHPLTWLSLMLDAQLYGPRAGGFHLTNLLLHAANTLLLFAWLRRTTAALWPAAGTAFLFAAHPLHVESVAWVTERKDVLSTCFLCLTLLAYSRYARGGPGRWRAYALALALYALGLMAKPMLVTLPPLLLLLDYWPLRRFPPAAWRAHWPGLLREKLPFAVLMAASCVVTYQAQRRQAVVSLEVLPAGWRLAAAVLGVGSYLQKTVWPLGLGIFYPYWYGVAWWRPAGWALGLVGLTAGALWRGRAQPYLAVGWLWFLGTLVPVIGLVQVGSQAVADRYLYVPHIGLFLALCWGAEAAWLRWPRARGWLGGGAALVAAACLGLSVRQARYWQSGAVLLEHTIAVTALPSAQLYQLYGDALGQIPGRQADAERAYLRSLQLQRDPDNQDAILSLSALWLRAKRWPDVVRLLTPPSQNKDAARGMLNNLAFALLRTGQEDGALALYQRCVAQYPDYPTGHFGLADCLRQRGDVPGACAEYEAGLARQDSWHPALTFLAWTYAHLDDPAAHARALALARCAVELDGGRDAGGLDALAAAEAATGHWPQAVAAAQGSLALAVRPGLPPATAAVSRARLESYQQGRLP